MDETESSSKNMVIPVVASVLTSVLLTYLALSKRIGVSEDFPSDMLDWFAIIGGLMLVSLAFLGLIGLVKVIRS